MSSLAARHQAFHDLHQSGCFVMPNPWDMGTARMMAASGAKALATSSAAHAFTLGRPDMGGVSRDEALAHAETIVAATPLPVSGDFENGFGDTPETVAETVRLAAEAGLSTSRWSASRRVRLRPGPWAGRLSSAPAPMAS
jgi:2-methylisocitrate lyase-like PEP mutase family enzyme